MPARDWLSERCTMVSMRAICVLLMFFQTLGIQADVPDAQRREVEHLINYLKVSTCQMVRNGKAYDGDDGAKHVRRKYNHFQDQISNTEQFIEYAATKSTMSGKLYEVNCPGQDPTPSRDWLLQELKTFRAM